MKSKKQRRVENRRFRESQKARGWRGYSAFVPPEVYPRILEYKKKVMAEYWEAQKAHPIECEVGA